jgi:dTDP-4-dehydrorhamnose reductase
MIWLIGNKGMLGSEVEKLLIKNNLTFLSSGREVDVTDYSAIERHGREKKIEWIVNCSGYTRVNKAEEEKESAFKINREGVKNISLYCLKKEAKLIHISTDYVFEGNKKESYGYNENDKVNPLSVYGKSKLAGEEEVKKILDEYFILRTAWLYGLNGNNFVSTILRLFREKKVVRVVDDQWGSPTYTVDLAEVILKIIRSGSGKFGIYHFTNEGVVNWYEFARVIYDRAERLCLLPGNRQVEIKAIKTKEYPTAVIRSKYLVLSKDKIKREFNLKIRNWDEALEDFLSLLKINKEKGKK